MKIDQIAFGVKDKMLWDRLTAEFSEVTDVVSYEGKFENRKIYGKACLGFDYRQGIEREYLCYDDPYASFHVLIPHNDIFLSHLASHVDSIDYYLATAGVAIRETVVMDILTLDHSNPKLKELGRTYRYVIMDWRMTHGYFYKLIQRIEKPRSDTA